MLRYICFGLVIVVSNAADAAESAPFKVVAHRQDHRTLQLDRSFIAEPLRIGSKTFTRGLGMHANSLTVIELGKGCKSFKCQVGADLNDPTRAAGGSVVFVVKTDGKERFRSKILKPGDEPLAVSVDLNGARKLELITDVSINGFTGDHADWADARIALADGKDAYISEQMRRQSPPAKLPSPPPAPRTGPTEPETRTLTADEARAQLRAEWLFQAEGKPLAQRAGQEIIWAKGIELVLSRTF